MQPRSRRVPGADGLSLHLLEWSQEGVPLLFVHGFSNEAHIWDDAAPLVAPHYRTLALDLRGHGDSDHDPQGRYEPDAMCLDLEAVTRHLGIQRLVLVGHSLGGRVATLFAGAHPERLAGLVIVDAGPELDWRGVTRIRLDAQQAPDSFGSPTEFEAMLARAYPMARPEAIARMARHGLRRRDDGRFTAKLDPAFRTRRTGSPEEMDAWMAQQERALWEALERIACPTLVVRGAASDVLSPETADRMVEEVLAQGRLEVIPRAGHSVMTDNPDAFDAALCRFVLGEG